jgi:hypothetical protein
MHVRSLVAGTAMLTFGSLLLALTFNAKGGERQGPTVQVSVQASDTSGGTLHYKWQSTDGVIQQADSKTTSWTLPPGRGIHFAYVLVSNGKGGYIERRISINTDSFGEYFDDDDTAPTPLPSGPNQLQLTNNALTSSITGSVTLLDGTPCGIANEFFGVHVYAQATVLDAGGNPLVPPVQILADEFGNFNFIPVPSAGFIRLTCENAAPRTLAIPSSGTFSTQFPDSSRPTVSGMTATLRGRPLPPLIAKFEPPATGLPSDVEPLADGFLSASTYLSAGVDSRKGACQYYKAIGAIGAATDCNNNGAFVQPITYRQWKEAVQIGRFAAAGGRTFRAAFVNKVDLNLARVHQSISYPDKTAAVVCNHVGTKNFFNPTQFDIDTAVLNAVENRDLVVCVAMDYMVNPAIQTTPFVRFMIFGPGGELLPSVNLDGRGEKFVPGTCTVCHGGGGGPSGSFTKFPEDGSGKADIGAHFLPYDVGNFEFANVYELRKCDQQEAIYNLNQNVLHTGPTQAETDLIGVAGVSGWYKKPNNGACSPHVTHVLDESYLPPEWQTFQSQNLTSNATDFYTNVVARSCRTCHVAQSGFNWDSGTVNNNIMNLNILAYKFELPIPLMCGNTQIHNTMPNSLVTFNRFWITSQNIAGFPNQVQSAQTFLGQNLNAGNCRALAEVMANPFPASP